MMIGSHETWMQLVIRLIILLATLFSKAVRTGTRI